MSRLISSASTEIKLGGFFGTRYTVSFSLDAERIWGYGFCQFEEDGRTHLDYQLFDVSVSEIKKAYVEMVEGFNSAILIYRVASSIRLFTTEKKMVLLGIDNPENCAKSVQETAQKAREKKAREEQRNKLLMEQQQKAESEAQQFYEECYAFHIKPETPVFPLSSEKNKTILIYVDTDKALNFLGIDGYKREESVGIISYDRIHYYERAGNVSYTTDIHGTYSSFGGSMTGAQFSKAAAAVGGALFGLMGMTMGALFSYKPAEIKPATTEFKIDSNVVKIDDRNVILNFFSDARGQFVDLELPKEIFNFLQTFLPDKRYSIVEELERKAAVARSAAEQAALPKSDATAALPSADNAEKELAAFRIKVEKLKMMKEMGILTDDEFEAERKKLLLSL